MNEVAKAEQGGQLPATQSVTLLSHIIAASANPEVDANKMEQMANLALRLQDRERETQYAQDFAAAVMEMPRISKRNEIIIPGKEGKPGRVQGKFASWENIDAVIRPILARHNLVLTFRIGQAEAGAVAVTPVLTHTSGYREVGDPMRVPADTSGSKNAAQAVGSSSQYGKRYAACAILNIVTEGEDRDGTSYPLASDELNDRQQRKVDEAYAAHKDGNYQAFWDKQTAQDRELLVIRGVHAELTGAPQIPGPRTIPVDTDADTREDTSGVEIDDSARDEPDNSADTSGGKRTAAQLVEDYEKRVDTCKSTDELMDLQRDPKVTRWLAQLKDRDSELFDRATTASSKRYATLLAEEDKAKQAGQGNLV